MYTHCYEGGVLEIKHNKIHPVIGTWQNSKDKSKGITQHAHY